MVTFRNAIAGKATNGLQIINVCENRNSFSKFEQDVRRKVTLGCSFACVHHSSQISPSRKIGQRTTRRQIQKDRERDNLDKNSSSKRKIEKDPFICDELNLKVLGLAVSWDEDQVYFISFSSDNGKYNLVHNNL